MAGILKKLSLVPTGLRYKLMIMFSLMSIIPLLVCVYIVTWFVFPATNQMGAVSIVILVTIFISILGFILAKQMIEPIIDMAVDAKMIAEGDYERSIDVMSEDEIGDLGASLNMMTQKIKDNISELKSYGEKTREINSEIHKKVMALSGLLQIGNLISAGTDLKTVLDILSDKMATLDVSNSVSIMMVDQDRDKDSLIPLSTINFNNVEAAKLPSSIHQGIFARINADLKEIIIDNRVPADDEDVRNFRSMYKLTNCAIMPIIIRGSLEGVILIGNNETNFAYKQEDVELLRVFSKQTAIAMENDFLVKKAEELEVKDELTGLYNNKYIRERLEEEIRRAVTYQRPCSFLLLKVDDFTGFCEKYNRVSGEAALKKMARLIATELTAVDKAGRFTDDEFAFILPERNKKEAKQIADDIRSKIAELLVAPQAEDKYKHLTVSGSLSENPIDGVSAKELIDKAQSLLDKAKAEGSNIIKV